MVEDAPEELSLHPADDLPWHDAGTALHEDLADREMKARIRAQIVGETLQPLHVGRFRLLRKLGQGGMGTVHAAYDEELDREIAIKVLHPWYRHDEHATQRMRREATALARLSHPNLVPVFEVGEHEGQVFLVMELVHGIDMREWVRQHPRPWQAVLVHWLDVARALANVHEAGLVHRDVKPSNVLVGEDGRARLVDFGLARGQSVLPDGGGSTLASQPGGGGIKDGTGSESGVDRLHQIITESRGWAGTPAYMAPEVLSGEPAGPRADQYSLCVSIYECLHGTRPPPRARDGSRLAAPEPAGVPLAVRRALTRGLAAEPGERFADVSALVRALERSMSRRRRRLAVGGAALLVAAAAGGLVARGLEPEATAMVDPCAAVDDDLHGVWDEPRRTELREAILATALPYAPRLAEQLDRLLG
jgi:serine/threonine protein kinase